VPTFLSNFNQIWILSTDYASLQYKISQKISSMGAEVIHVDRQTWQN